MHELHAQTVLLTRAFEEEDRERLLLSRERRAGASRLARDESGDDEAFVRRRAEVLGEHLARTFPLLPRLLRVIRLRFAPVPAVAGIALLAGLASNALGPRRQVNLLSLPLLGLLGWNLLAYAVLVVSSSRLVRGRWGPSTWLGRGTLNRVRAWRIGRGASTSGARIASAAVARFADLWWRHAGRLLVTRGRCALHAGAVAFAAGVVGGMYLRGLAFEYRAVWESTFLDAGTVQTLLDRVLGPAAAVLRTDVPDVGPARASGGGAEAAPWIHLYAMTATLVVLVPRAFLAAYHGWRARRLAADVPVRLDDGYYRRLLAEGGGAGVRIEVLPYSFEPGPAGAGRLRGLLQDFFGVRASVRVRPPLAYGDEPPAGRGTETPTCTAVVFSLAQSPEAEVHGRFLERMASGPDRERSLLVLVDASKYRKRVETPDRWSERADAWRRVVRGAGSRAVVVDLDEAGGADRALDEMGAALAPAKETGRP